MRGLTERAPATVEHEDLATGEGGWQLVRRKKLRRPRLDIASDGLLHEENIISFFFSDFPDSHRAKDMLSAFAYYGKVVEVVIPPKTNKWGKRFGFVRFIDVQDPRMFAIQLDNIIIGADKIHVNLPRFERERFAKQPAEKVHRMKTPAAIHPRQRPRAVWREVVRPHGDVMPSVSCVNQEQAVKVPGTGVRTENRRNPWNIRGIDGGFRNPDQSRCVPRVVYNASNDELARFNRMYVAEVKNAGGTHMVQEWFSGQGVFSIKVTPMGANLVLLEEMDDGYIQAILDDSEEWFYEVFSDIRKWSQKEIDNERVVWIRCHGIPLHAWNNDFFSELALNFGTFLGVDENTKKKNTLDVARVLIRTKCYDVFNMVVEANINGTKFEVKIFEEWCGSSSWEGITWPKELTQSVSSSDSVSDSDDDDGPPLRTAEEGVDDWSEDDGEDGEDGEPGEPLIQEGICVNEGGAVVTADLHGVGIDNRCERNGDVQNGGAVDVGDGEGVNENKAGSLKDVVAAVGNPTTPEVPTVQVVHATSQESHSEDRESRVDGVEKLGPANVAALGLRNKFGRDNSSKVKHSVTLADFANFAAGMSTPDNASVKEDQVVRRKNKKKVKRKTTVRSSSENSITVGVVNEEARGMIPALRGSRSSTGEGSAGGDISVGDSGVRCCNEGFLKEHEISIGNKLWSFAKQSLGVVGPNKDEEFADKYSQMEARDQLALGGKENNTVSP